MPELNELMPDTYSPDLKWYQKLVYYFFKIFGSTEFLGGVTFLLCILLTIGSIRESVRFESRINQLQLEKQLIQDKLDAVQEYKNHLIHDNEQLKKKLDMFLDPDFMRFRRYDSNSDIHLNMKHYKAVRAAADKYDLDWLLLSVLIHSESNFLASVTHKNVNTVGLGGINTKYWSISLIDEGIIIENEDLFDDETNIEATAFVLRTLLNKHKDNVLEALHSYKGRGYDTKLGTSGKSLASKVYAKYIRERSNEFKN